MIKKHREKNKHIAQNGYAKEEKGMDGLGHVEEKGHVAEFWKKKGQLQKPAHISRDLFCDWQEGKLKEPEETDFFTHIGACTFCAEQFANWMEEGFLDEPMPEMERGFLDEPMPSMEGRIEDAVGHALETGRPAAVPSGKSASNLARDSLRKEPPRYLKEEILNRTRQLDVQASVKLKETSRQVQLMVYSLKVGFAVVASIFLLAVTADIQHMGLELPRDQQPGQVQEQAGEQQAEPGQPDAREEEEGIVSRLRRGSKELTGLLNELSNGLFRIEMGNSENKRNQEVTR